MERAEEALRRVLREMDTPKFVGVDQMTLPRCRPYRPEDQAKLHEFECSTKPTPDEFELEIAEWIKDEPEGIIDSDISKGYAEEIYVYVISDSDDEKIIAYAVLGTELWMLPSDEGASQEVKVSMIAMLGLHKEFQGKRTGGDGTERYSTLIFQDILDRAVDRSGPPRAVGLYVHEENGKAIKLYERNGFSRVKNVNWINPRFNKSYHGMIYYAPDEI